MQRSDGRLHGKRSRFTLKCLPDQRQCFGDLGLIPVAAILLFKNNQIAGWIETGIAPCIVEQHERYQASYFRRRLGRR